MSKRKKKFKNQQFTQTSAPASVAAVSSVAQAQPQPQAVQAPAPAQIDPNQAAYAAHKDEYDNVHKDLIRVLVVNGLLFAVVLTVYFVNQRNGFLGSWFNQIF